MRFETAFTRAWGRPPSKAELASVERVCDAFEVHDNDALKAIAGLLEYYHAHLRVYPSQCTTAVQQWLGSAEGSAAIGKALRVASSAPERSPSPPPPPPPLPSAPSAATDARHWVTLGGLASASSAISGALGMLVGAALSGRQPCWLPRNAADPITVALVGAPMGWVVLLSLIVPAYFGASRGWRCGADPRRSTAERCIGWAAAASIAIFVLGWSALIARYVLNG